MATKTTTSDVAVTPTQEVKDTGTFVKVRNVASRPIEINFSDKEGVQRIDSKSVAYVDENRLKASNLAKNQFNRFVGNNILRVLKKNCKKEVK